MTYTAIVFLVMLIPCFVLINNKQIPKELGELKPMENSVFNSHVKWKLKEFVEVGKKVEKSTKIKAISFLLYKKYLKLMSDKFYFNCHQILNQNK